MIIHDKSLWQKINFDLRKSIFPFFINDLKSKILVWKKTKNGAFNFYMNILIGLFQQSDYHGKNHPETLGTLYNLGLNYRDQFWIYNINSNNIMYVKSKTSLHSEHIKIG